MMLLQLRKFFLLVGLFIATIAHAELMPPDQLVKQITQETYMYVNQDTSLQKGDISKLIDWAEKSILKDFDFNRMTRLAVGKDWRQATPEQQKQLVYEFRKLLIRTFANAFIGIKKEQTIEFLEFLKQFAPEIFNDPLKKRILLEVAFRVWSGEWDKYIDQLLPSEEVVKAEREKAFKQAAMELLAKRLKLNQPVTPPLTGGINPGPQPIGNLIVPPDMTPTGV